MSTKEQMMNSPYGSWEVAEKIWRARRDDAIERETRELAERAARRQKAFESCWSRGVIRTRVWLKTKI